MNPAEKILRTLGKHLEGPAHVRLLGGAALILGYGLGRTTEDVDLLLDDQEIELLVERAGMETALERTNKELEPTGLYLTHIWGPEQQILSKDWRKNCRDLDRDWGTSLLAVSTLGPLDLILSKLCRADDADLDDIRFLIDAEQITPDDIEAAIGDAMVPKDFASVFPGNCDRIRTLVQR